MSLKKTLTVGALALTFSYAGLASALDRPANTSTPPQAMGEKGSDHKCGAAKKKKDSKTKKVTKKGEKGTDHKCGANKCGKNSCG